jgi:hypothetical protein
LPRIEPGRDRENNCKAWCIVGADTRARDDAGN